MQMHFYRYRPYSEVSLKELMYNEMYFSSSEECNDPFDGKTFYVFDSDKEKWTKLVQLSVERTNAKIPDRLLSPLADYLCKQCPMTFDEAARRNLLVDYPSSSPNDNVLISFIGMKIQDILRVYKPATRNFVSFSTDKSEPLMWSHYADKHKGFCLIFKAINGALNQSPTQKKKNVSRTTKNGIAPNMSCAIPESFKFTKIDYEPEVKPLSAFLHLPVYITGEANDKEEASRILKEKESHYKQKSVSWQYESEYRLMLQPPIPWLFGEHFDYTQQERLFHYQPSQLVGIIYGARTEVSEKNRIKEILKERSDWLSYSAIEKTIEFNFVEFEAKLATNQRKVEIIPTGLMTYHTIPVSDPDFNRLYQEWQDGWGWERHNKGIRKIKVD
ncbi:MAG TPA: DUF2971 domain-containing protein [Prolixibacteraceae bacterium]|nr:DUF2971 domain-containing protein [Prolixibacteraceae bacterium]